MPTVDAIARHHGRQTETCWRCGDRAFLVRAHLWDRVFGGSDDVANLALLCDWCHDRMPNNKSTASGQAYAMPANPGAHQKGERLREILGNELWTECIAAGIEEGTDRETTIDILVNLIGSRR